MQDPYKGDDAAVTEWQALTAAAAVILANVIIVNDIDFCTLTAGWQVSTRRTKEAMRALVTEDNEVMACQPDGQSQMINVVHYKNN